MAVGKSENVRPSEEEVAQSSPSRSRRKNRIPANNCETEIDLLARVLWRDNASNAEAVLLRKIVDRYGSVGALLAAPFSELASEDPFGRAGAIRLHMLRKVLTEGAFAMISNKPIVNKFNELIVYLQWVIGRSTSRDIYLIYANNANCITHSELIARDIAEVHSARISHLMAAVIAAHAHSVILAWNNLDSHAEPSVVEIDFARDFRAACELHSIVMLDLIVVAKGHFYSGRQAGWV